MHLRELSRSLIKFAVAIHSCSHSIELPTIQDIKKCIFKKFLEKKEKAHEHDSLTIHPVSFSEGLYKLNSFISRNKNKKVYIVIYCNRLCTNIAHARLRAQLVINALKRKGVTITRVIVMPHDTSEYIKIYSDPNLICKL